MEPVATKRTPPARVRYDFGRLTERGTYFFVEGSDKDLAHRVRQAAFSYMKHHSKVRESGDRIAVYKEDALRVKGVKDGTPGVGVYRVAAGG